MTPSNVSIFKRFFSLLQPDTSEIKNIYLFAILSGILSLGLPLGIQMIISFIQLGQISASWLVLVLLVSLANWFLRCFNDLSIKDYRKFTTTNFYSFNV